MDTSDTRLSERRPVAVRVLGWLVAGVLGIVVALALLHVFIRPIPPEQEAPDRHVPGPCILCHLVSESADPVELP